MRVLIYFALMLSAVAGYKSSTAGPLLLSLNSNLLKEPSSMQELSETTQAQELATAAVSSSSSASAQTSETASAAPSTAQPGAASSLLPPLEESTAAAMPAFEPAMPLPGQVPYGKRRVVTYDQRQEGQYNIRADLENFMIVLIPQNSDEGMNLLDLFTKAPGFLRGASHASKNKKKHYSSSASLQSMQPQKFYAPLKSNAGSSGMPSYFPRQAEFGGNNRAFDDYSASLKIPEFIEGRTPYHVDISASDEEQSRLHPDRQVDVLPPASYPLAYQQLIKPYHLEAEPTVIQALPPHELASQQAAGNFLDTYNHIMAARHDAGKAVDNNAGSYFRLSRSLRGDKFKEFTSPLSSNSLSDSFGNRAAARSTLPLFRADLSFGPGSIYPPIDVPEFSSYLNAQQNSKRNFELKSSASSEQQENEKSEQDLEQPLGKSLIVPQDYELAIGGSDAVLKALLGDIMERCAPGHRRDSYGQCREIEGY